MADPLTIIAVIIPISGALLLYFGKIIGDRNIEKQDTSDHYLNGFLFVLNYVVMPSLAVYLVRDLGIINALTLWSFSLIMIVQFIIILSFRDINPLNTINRKLFGNRFGRFFFSFITILNGLWVFQLAGSLVDDFKHAALLVVYALYVVLILTLIAKSEVRYKEPFAAKVYVKNMKDPITGELLAVRDFVSVLHEEQRIQINRDCVEYIEYLPKNEKNSKPTAKDVEFARELYPKPSREIQILVRIGQTGPVLSESFTETDKVLVKELEAKKRLVVKEGQVRLTELGKEIARGAELIYNC